MTCGGWEHIPAPKHKGVLVTFAWRFYSLAEIKTALEDYDALACDQPVPGDGGDMAGDLQEQDRLYRLYARNQAIDGAMAELFYSCRVSWRVLRMYYLQGLWSERWGWVAAAKAAGLDVPVCMRGTYTCAIPGDHRRGEHKLKTCPRGDVCLAHHERFLRDVLPLAIERLAEHVMSAEDVPLDTVSGQV